MEKPACPYFQAHALAPFAKPARHCSASEGQCKVSHTDDPNSRTRTLSTRRKVPSFQSPRALGSPSFISSGTRSLTHISRPRHHLRPGVLSSRTFSEPSSTVSEFRNARGCELKRRITLLQRFLVGAQILGLLRAVPRTPHHAPCSAASAFHAKCHAHLDL